MSIFLGIISLIIAGLAALYAYKSSKSAQRSADVAESSHTETLKKELDACRRKLVELEQQLTDKEKRDKLIKSLKKMHSGSLFTNGEYYCQKCLSDYTKPVMPIFIEDEEVSSGNYRQICHCYVCGAKYEYEVK